MASSFNSAKDVSGALPGVWEDVKDYTSSIITLNSLDASGRVTVEWAHTEGRRLPDTSADIVATEFFDYTTSGQALTRQFDHRARWFRLKYDPGSNDLSYNLQTLYKKAPTELKIVDESANIVSVNAGLYGNSLYTVLTDSSGQLLKTTTVDSSGEALFVHLADASGVSLDTTDNEGAKSLFVGLRDGNNMALSSTGPTAVNNALFVRPSDASGVAQASTINVHGAYTEGVALFAALADTCGFQITTTKRAADTSNNALFVHLTDQSGNSIDVDNPLPVISTVATVGSIAFDVSSGITERFVFPSTDLSGVESGKQINLYNVFLYNDGATTAWLKVYDVSAGGLDSLGLLGDLSGAETSLNLVATQIKYNLTVQPHRTRDLAIPGGATFENGVAVRATTQYKADSILGPAEDSLFLNGAYTKENSS